MKRTNALFMAAAMLTPVWGKAANHTNIIVINLDDVEYSDFSCNGAIGYLTRRKPTGQRQHGLTDKK